MSSLMEVLVDGEYELVVEALSRLRQIKVEALAVAGEHPETRMFTAADFGIDKIDALFRKLDAEPDVRADAVAGDASAVPVVGIEAVRKQLESADASLKTIEEGSAVSGRYLDASGAECEEDDEGAIWHEYSREEQDAWLDTVAVHAAAARQALQSAFGHPLFAKPDKPGEDDVPEGPRP